MDASIEARLKTILKHSVSASLKPHGFRKHGNTYICRLAELSWVFELQKNRWNTSSVCEFTFNCGIYVPGLMPIYANIPEPAIPRQTYCCLWARIARLAKQPKDVWWTLKAEETLPVEDELAGKQISEWIETFVIPFFARFTRMEDVIAYLSSPRPADESGIWPITEVMRLLFLGILYFLNGQQETSCLTLIEAETKAGKSESASGIAGIRKKICLS